MTSGTRDSYQRAITRATAAGLVSRVRVYSHAAGLYRVPSTSSRKTYTVQVRGDAWSCSCEAGQRSLPCLHQGAAWLRRAADSMTSRQRAA